MSARSISPPFVRSISAAVTLWWLSWLKSPAWSVSVPKGAFYLMAHCLWIDADKFQQWLLEEFEDNGDTVMFAPGEPFYGTPGKGKTRSALLMC